MNNINKLKISIIIPCYNEENFISRCLDTIINQTIDNFEIIIVNDGSTDNTPQICEEYKAKYPNTIKVIHQKNAGQGYARNAGIELSAGEYIGFVDADDWVDPTMYQKMYENAKKNDSDITFCDIKKIIVEAGYEINELSMPYKEGLIDIGSYLKDGLNNAYSMNRIYKRSIWNNYRYKKMVYEDLELMFTLQSNCERISYVQEFLCTYFKHPGSTTTTFNDIRLLDMISAYRNAIYNCNKKYINEVSFNIANRLLRYLKTDGLDVYKAEFIEIINELMPFFENNVFITNDTKTSKILDYKGFETLPNTICYANFGNKQDIDTSKWKLFTRKTNFIELNEELCNIELAPEFIREAYNSKNYLLVGEYFKIRYLFHNGGIAVKNEIVFNKPIGKLRCFNDFFLSNENGVITNDIYGLKKGSLAASWLLKSICEYNTIDFNSIIKNEHIVDTIKIVVYD